MTRSLEAIKQRAEKRGRSISEQKAADWAAVKAQELKKYPDQLNYTSTIKNKLTSVSATATAAIGTYECCFTVAS